MQKATGVVEYLSRSWQLGAVQCMIMETTDQCESRLGEAREEKHRGEAFTPADPFIYPLI